MTPQQAAPDLERLVRALVVSRQDYAVANPGREWWRAAVEVLGKIAPPTHEYRCQACGGAEVEQEEYLDLNTNEPTGSEGGDLWCRDCESHSGGLCFIRLADGYCEYCKAPVSAHTYTTTDEED